MLGIGVSHHRALTTPLRKAGDEPAEHLSSDRWPHRSHIFGHLGCHRKKPRHSWLLINWPWLISACVLHTRTIESKLSAAHHVILSILAKKLHFSKNTFMARTVYVSRRFSILVCPNVPLKKAPATLRDFLRHCDVQNTLSTSRSMKKTTECRQIWCSPYVAINLLRLQHLYSSDRRSRKCGGKRQGEVKTIRHKWYNGFGA